MSPVFRTLQEDGKDLKLEALYQPLYDHVEIKDDTIDQVCDTTISFFQSPQGRPSLCTNVETAGHLPHPKRFSVRGFRIVLGPNTDPEDAAHIYETGGFEFKVGETSYFRAPLSLLAMHEKDPDWSAIVDNTVVDGDEKEFTRDNVYKLQHSIWIPSRQNFRAILTIGPFTPKAPVHIWVFLEGELFREIIPADDEPVHDMPVLNERAHIDPPVLHDDPAPVPSMEPINFCYWVQGYFEISPRPTLKKHHIDIIKDHLNLVFAGPMFPGVDLEAIYFCHWLKGILDIFEDELNKNDVKIIKNRVQEVFIKVTGGGKYIDVPAYQACMDNDSFLCGNGPRYC